MYIKLIHNYYMRIFGKNNERCAKTRTEDSLKTNFGKKR